MANVSPPSNKASAKPICAALVMIFSEPSPDPAKEHPTGAGRSQTETLVAPENVRAAAPVAFPANLIIVRRGDHSHPLAAVILRALTGWCGWSCMKGCLH